MAQSDKAKVEAAIRFVASTLGSQSAIARLFNPPIRQQSVYSWLRDGSVPADRVMRICKAVNRRVKPHELNPSFYNPEFVDFILSEYGRFQPVKGETATEDETSA
jgi:DNA-binding transcriptional regulator YdaS (Cro superfamily)